MNQKTAANATLQQVVAATILRAYYDGKLDSAFARYERSPRGLMNAPDDDQLVKLLWGEEDDPLDEGDKEMLSRAMQLAETVMLFLDKERACYAAREVSQYVDQRADDDAAETIARVCSERDTAVVQLMATIDRLRQERDRGRTALLAIHDLTIARLANEPIGATNVRHDLTEIARLSAGSLP